jgi:flagellum-specific peptidoglycan hydrolase FlgJ
MRRAWIILAFVVVAFLILGYMKMTRDQFKQKFYSEIAGLDLKGFPAWLLAGLASYESGDGSGNLAGSGRNNIFSLQAPKSWKGSKILQTSTGNWFRAYPSYREAVADFLNLLIGWPTKYGKAVDAAKNSDAAAFAGALQVAGYGDPGKTTYGSELLSRIKAFQV